MGGEGRVHDLAKSPCSWSTSSPSFAAKSIVQVKKISEKKIDDCAQLRLSSGSPVQHLTSRAPHSALTSVLFFSDFFGLLA